MEARFKKIIEDLTLQLNNARYSGDLSDIGNEIGIVIAKYFTEDDDLTSFIHGVKHGVSLTDGTHSNPKNMKTLYVSEGTEYEFGQRSMGYYVSESLDELKSFIKEYNSGGSHECYYRCDAPKKLNYDERIDLSDLFKKHKMACYSQQVSHFDKLADIKHNGSTVKFYFEIQ